MRAQTMKGFEGIAPGTVLLFGASAIIVGALGSAELWALHFGGQPVPFGRIFPVILVWEVLVYFAVMLAQLGGSVSGPAVAAGAAVGVAIRFLEACGAALIGSPEAATGFLDAVRHYHASYYPAALLQVFVAALFLWLVRGLFEAKPRPLLGPRTDVPDMPPDRAKGLEEFSPMRRRQLVEALRRSEAEAGDVGQASPVELAPPDQPARATESPAASQTEQTAAPSVLTPQQSVIAALRDEGPPAGVVPSLRPEPEPLGLAGVGDVIGEVARDLGAPELLVDKGADGHAVILAAGPGARLQEAMAAASKLLVASASLCQHAGSGAFRRLLLHLASGCVGAATVVQEGRGLFIVVALPPPANLGKASVALDSLASPVVGLQLPTWPPISHPDYPPATADADLSARLLPLLEWVPEAAELSPLTASAGGRQVLALARGEATSVETAAAIAYSFAQAEALCSALGTWPCDLALWIADGGTVACASTIIGGQHMLVALVDLGTGDPAPVSLALSQILNGLHRAWGGAGGGGG